MSRRIIEKEEDNSMDGAVDIVFLLIIFFLVTSAFTTEVKERLAIPPKKDDTPEQPTPPPEDKPVTPIQQLRIVVFGESNGNQVWFNTTPIPVSEDITTDLYYRTVERINEMRREAIEEGIVPLPETGYPPLNVKLHSDKGAFTGYTLHALMATLDCSVTPEIKFDQELNPDAILEEAAKEREMLEKLEGGK